MDSRPVVSFLGHRPGLVRFQHRPGQVRFQHRPGLQSVFLQRAHQEEENVAISLAIWRSLVMRSHQGGHHVRAATH